MRRYLFRPEVLVLLLAISLFGAKKVWTEVNSKQNYTCDASGVRTPSSSSSCQVGDTGPGGGIVFFVAATPFACGPTLSSGCTYLEAAPLGWNVDDWCGGGNTMSGNSDPACPWSGSDDLVGIDTAIGTGKMNTRKIIVAQSFQAHAASLAQDYLGGGLKDWYLPSRDELNELYKQKALVGGIFDYYYWSSSESTETFAGPKAQSASGEHAIAFVRPVRAFGEDGPVEVSSWQIGDIGPAGGIVFYVAATPFACGPTLASTCTYLEAAPTGWSYTPLSECRQLVSLPPLDQGCAWLSFGIEYSVSPDVNIGTDTAIGTGYKNTLAIIAAHGAQAQAASASQAYAGGDKTDWYLPSKDELNELYLQHTTLGPFVANVPYWSSSESSAADAWSHYFGGGLYGDSYQGSKFKWYGGHVVRPVRAFD